MNERNIQQLETQISDQQFESLVKEYRQSLLACASRTVKHFVTEQDEEWSVTLQAFYEAVKGYDGSRGQFWPFASVIVRRRLTDWMRDLYRHREEMQEDTRLRYGVSGKGRRQGRPPLPEMRFMI